MRIPARQARESQPRVVLINKKNMTQWERNVACFPDKYNFILMVPHHTSSVSVASSIKTLNQTLKLLFQLTIGCPCSRCWLL